MDLQVCSGQPLDLQVEIEGDCPNEVQWSNGLTGSLINTGNLVNNTCEPIEVTFTATIESTENCPKQEQTFVVTILPIPSMNNISVNKEDCRISVEACPIFEVMYSVNGGVAQIGNAYTAAAGEVADVVFTFSHPDCGNYTLEEQINCSNLCPTIEAVNGEQNIGICSGEVIELGVNVLNGNSEDVRWSNGAIGGIIAIDNLSNTTCEPIVEIFTAEIPASDNCESAFIDFEVTVYPNPANQANVEVSEDNCTVTASACPNVDILYQLSDGSLTMSDTYTAELGSGINMVNFFFTSPYACGNVAISATINCVANGAIGNYVWNDLNQNGIQDLGEPGIGGIFVHLYSADGTLLGTTRTDEDGFYLFDDLPAGDYYVVFDIPNNYTTTTINAGTDDGMDSDANPSTGQTEIISLGQGEVNLTIDAGLVGTDVGAIGNLVWMDVNGNGVQDVGEPGVADVTINLLDDEGNVIETTTTDENGNYSFTDLPPGDYQIEVVNDGFEIVETNQGDDEIDNDVDSDTGLSDIIVIVGGETDISIDIGIRPTDCSNIVGIFASNSDCLVTDGLLSIETNEVTLGFGEMVVYVLYTDPHDILGSIIAQSSTPFFALDTQVNPDVFVAAISGPDTNADGLPDEDALCFNIEEGPSIQAQTLNIAVQAICAANDSDYKLLIQIFSEDGGTYDVLANGIVVNNVPTNQPFLLGEFSTDETYIVQVLEDGTDCVLAIESGLGDCTKLPVSLLEFTGEIMEDGNLLQWITASELNNDYFNLHYSTDGIDFEIIATIEGNGNSSEAHLYDFLHRNPANGTTYYYLSQTDFDGSNERISQVISLQRTQTDFSLIEVLPIPSSDFVDVRFHAPKDANVKVVLYDAVGRMVQNQRYTAKSGYNELTLGVQNLAAGVYVLSMNMDGEQVNVKIVVE